MNYKKKDVWTKSKRNWTFVLYTTCHVCYWRLGHGSHNLLQKASRAPCWKMGALILIYHGMATMQIDFFTATICHTVYPRSSFQHRSRFQSTPINGPGYLRTANRLNSSLHCILYLYFIFSVLPSRVYYQEYATATGDEIRHWAFSTSQQCVLV